MICIDFFFLNSCGKKDISEDFEDILFYFCVNDSIKEKFFI